MRQFAEETARLKATLPQELLEPLNHYEAIGDFHHPEYEAAMMEFYGRFICRLDLWPEPLMRSLNNLMSHLPGAEIEEHAQLSPHIATPFNPVFKGVWQSRLAAHEVNNAISESIAWFRERGAPFAFWWIDPGATTTDLGARLQAQGFAPVGRKVAVHR